MRRASAASRTAAMAITAASMIYHTHSVISSQNQVVFHCSGRGAAAAGTTRGRRKKEVFLPLRVFLRSMQIMHAYSALMMAAPAPGADAKRLLSTTASCGEVMGVVVECGMFTRLGFDW